MEWQFGDVNPLMHDGQWVRKITENEYQVIRVYPSWPDGQNEPVRWAVEDVNVNITDSWIKLDSVKQFADNPEDGALALACVEYYGVMNFGHYTDVYCDTEEEVREWLGHRGITLEDE